MNQFQPGDPVRIIATPSRYHGVTGTVLAEVAGQFRVDAEGGPLWFFPHEIERVSGE